jgi:hypothetical protein
MKAPTISWVRLVREMAGTARELDKTDVTELTEEEASVLDDIRIAASQLYEVATACLEEREGK